MASKQPGEEHIRQRLDSSITSLENQRTEGLKYTRLLQANKDRALKKEQKRLQKKYGPGHFREAGISRRLDYNRAAHSEMNTELERSRIQIPEFDADTWMVHGRVVNKEFTGIKGLTLALYDARGRAERRLGYACSDHRGYYAIHYKEKEGGKSPIDEKTDYFLIVTDAGGQTCHREAHPLHVVPGQVDYRLIILDGTQCQPPPDWNGESDKDEAGDNHDDGHGNQSGEWIVTGKVAYEDQKPGTALLVKVFSKQDEKVLTTAPTSRTGAFKFTLTTEAFPRLFTKKPDIYLIITERSGQDLHTTDKPLHPKAGGAEELNIVLKHAKPRRPG